MIEAKKYDEKFYDSQIDGSLESATVVLPIIQHLLNPKSVLDVGCGVGTWLKVWKETLNVSDIKGIDGEYVNRSQIKIPATDFIAKDLKQPFDLHRKFDLVMCLEVGEHLPEDTSHILVENLTKHGDVILFSSANLYQTGTYHINEKPPEFWAKLFQKKDFVAVDIIRDKIWNDNKVEWWYRQNIIVYVRQTVLADFPEFEQVSRSTNPEALFRIHPILWKFRNDEVEERSHWISFLRWKIPSMWKKKK